MIVFHETKRVLRVTALATAALFLNLALSVELAALFAGSGLSLQAAQAQTATDGRRVAVFVLPAKDADAQAALVLNSIIRQNTGLLSDVTLVTPWQAVGGERLAEAERLVDEGMGQLNARDYAAAQQTLFRAYALVEKALPAVSRRLHARVLKGLGVAKFLTGAKDEGRDLVKKSLLVFERQSAAEYGYSLEAKNLFRDVRREIQDLPTGTLEVASDPVGAEVFVDHSLRGYTLEDTPLVLQNLAAGPHFVRIVRDGYQVWAEFVEVEPASKESISPSLRPTPGGARFETLLADARKGLASGKGGVQAVLALRDHLKASEILVVRARSTSEGFDMEGVYLPPDGSVIDVMEPVVQDASLPQSLRDFTAMTVGGEYGEVSELALDSPTGAPEELELAPVGGMEELVINPDSPIFAGARRDEPTPVYKKWWFWTIVGVAVGGATTGIVLLSTNQGGGGGGPTGGVTVQLNQF